MRSLNGCLPATWDTTRNKERWPQLPPWCETTFSKLSFWAWVCPECEAHMNQPEKTPLLQQIAASPAMERGKISAHSSRRHLKLQRWQNGKNYTRLVSANELLAVQAALTAYAQYRQLTERCTAPMPARRARAGNHWRSRYLWQLVGTGLLLPRGQEPKALSGRCGAGLGGGLCPGFGQAGLFGRSR